MLSFSRQKHFLLLFGWVSDFHRFHKESKRATVFLQCLCFYHRRERYHSSCGCGRVTLSFRGTWGCSYQGSHPAPLCRCCAIYKHRMWIPKPQYTAASLPGIDCACTEQWNSRIKHSCLSAVGLYCLICMSMFCFSTFFFFWTSQRGAGRG